MPPPPLIVGWPASGPQGADRTQEPRGEHGAAHDRAGGQAAAGAHHAGTGEEWLLEPQRLDDTGRLWSPGIKTGVAPGSHFHLTEVFGPVLGLMRA